MTYDTARHLVATWGTLYFGVAFSIALFYALRPSRRRLFEHAARIPLEED